MNKYWSVLFAVVVILCFGLFAVAPLFGWWLPKNVSSFGGEVDFLFYLILGITTFFFVLTEALLVYAIWTFTSTPGRKAAFIHGNHKLEVMWTVVPAAILVLIGVLQISTWENIKYHSRMPKPKGNTQQMEVTARQWEWRVRYPSPRHLEEWASSPDQNKDAETWGAAPQADDVHVVNEIHIWSKQKEDKEDQKVLVHLKTRDVIHSFFLPTMRLKQDALPGKTIPVWFMAEDYNTMPVKVRVPGVGKDAPATEETRWVDGFDPKTGRFNVNDPKTGEPSQLDRIWDLACAEYCGTRHSMMKGKFYVHKDRKDFLEWLKSAEKAQNARQADGK